MINKLHHFIFVSIFFSLLISSPPKWIGDVSNDKYWVGIGIANISNSLPSEDPTMTAYLNAVQSLASQITISVESSIIKKDKEAIEIDTEGNITASINSSFQKNLTAKVKASLSNVDVDKRSEDGDNYYCKVKLSRKKYWKGLAKKRDDEVAKAKEKLQKVLVSDFDGNVLKYLDEALYGIMEFQYGIDNEFISMDIPKLTIKDCPESGTKLEGNKSDFKGEDPENSDSNKSSTNKSLKKPVEDKYAKQRKRSEELLKEMRERISNYSILDSEKNEKEKKPDVKEVEVSIDDINNDKDTDISDEEQKCKDCLNNESCKNPFSEACPCSETCGMAIQKELCEEKEISLVENLTFMLDDYVKRINFSGPENILNLKFGTQHERLTFRITDSYLDKMGFKSLNELIEERDRVIYKSKEWARIQNLINQLLDNSTRHDEGIVSLPLYNIPISISIGDKFSNSTYSDKGGYFNVDFPKYVIGATPYLFISLDLSKFNGYEPTFPPVIKIPIELTPLSIFLDIVETNEWNDDLGEPLEPYVINQFSNANFTFTDNKLEADRYMSVTSTNIINDLNNDMFKVNHVISLSFSDDTGIIYEKSIKNKFKTCFGTNNNELKNCASESKKIIIKKFKKELVKIYNSIMNK